MTAIMHHRSLQEVVQNQFRVPHDLSYGYKLLDLQIIQSHYSGPDMDRRGAISNVEYSNIT